MQDGAREHFLGQLALGKMQVSCVRLLVCGASHVGKTELITSLKSRFLRSRSPSCVSYFGTEARQHTYGFSVQQTSIPTAGEFSIWDFSGRKEYYPAHEFFLGSRNSIFLLVFSMLHSQKKQLAQLQFWLAMIKSKLSPGRVIQYAGNTGQPRPFIVLVGSFADQPRTDPSNSAEEDDIFAPTEARSSHLSSSISHKSMLRICVEQFGTWFMFTDTVFTLDCRQARSRGMRSLRSLLATLRSSLLKVGISRCNLHESSGRNSSLLKARVSGGCNMHVPLADVVSDTGLCVGAMLVNQQ